jgi:hypothetical protein
MVPEIPSDRFDPSGSDAERGAGHYHRLHAGAVGRRAGARALAGPRGHDGHGNSPGRFLCGEGSAPLDLEGADLEDLLGDRAELHAFEPGARVRPHGHLGA